MAGGSIRERGGESGGGGWGVACCGRGRQSPSAASYGNRLQRSQAALLSQGALLRAAQPLILLRQEIHQRAGGGVQLRARLEDDEQLAYRPGLAERAQHHV